MLLVGGYWRRGRPCLHEPADCTALRPCPCPCSGRICSKLYGKFKIYWPRQDQYGEVSPEEMADLDARAAAVETELRAAQARRKELAASLSALSSSLTAAELAASLEETRAEVAALKARVDRLKGTTALVTPAERARVKASLERYRKAWSSRKAMVMDVVDAMADGLEKKPKKLMDDIGIETDEDCKVNIRDFVV